MMFGAGGGPRCFTRKEESTMATERKKILIRRGNKADLVIANLQPGEPCLALDTNEIGVKTSGGTVLWFATLDANGKAKQDPASYGKVGGAATLNSNGKVIQDPASYGKAGGAATLNSNGKVIQNPASYGQPNGGATLNAQGKVIQDPATAYLPLPETDDNSTDQHWIKFADGTLIHWGYIGGNHSDINTPYGNAFWRQDFEYRLPTAAGAFVGNRYTHVTITSSALATAVNEVVDTDGRTLKFDIQNPASTKNLAFGFSYLIVGRWK
jgi:hypothetical protein